VHHADGLGPDTSVVNGHQRFWGISNLYAIDGSGEHLLADVLDAAA
jgi:choline dehydrogenase-like flavoprotein